MGVRVRSLRTWKAGGQLARGDAAGLGAKQMGQEMEQGASEKPTLRRGRKGCRDSPGALQTPAPGHPPADEMYQLSAAPGNLMALRLPRWAAQQVHLPAPRFAPCSVFGRRSGPPLKQRPPTPGPSVPDFLLIGVYQPGLIPSPESLAKFCLALCPSILLYLEQEPVEAHLQTQPEARPWDPPLLRQQSQPTPTLSFICICPHTQSDKRVPERETQGLQAPPWPLSHKCHQPTLYHT